MTILDGKRIFQFVIFVVAVSLTISQTTKGRFVSASISYYEAVEYNIRSVGLTDEQLRSSVKRSSLHGYAFELTAFGRNFSITVWPNSHIFQSHIQITVISRGQEETKGLKGNLVYQGKLKGEPESRVSGYIVSGSFSGVVSTKDGEIFYIEPLGDFNTSLAARKSPSTSAAIYKSTDINHKYTRCGSKFQPLMTKPPISSRRGHRHTKRGAEQYKSCPVMLAADSSFFKNVAKGSEVETLAKMSYHLAEADGIFRRTKFTKETVGLVIAAMKVFKDKESEGIFSSPEKIEINDYLQQWSRLDHGAYCLSLLFTYRDFPSGVLGLAWLADLNTLGGICESWNAYYNQSFNTAVVTLLNDGKLVPERVATVTVAHELGHSFGAQHDPKYCQPDGKEGNYIMFEHATDTRHPNNDKFSECSIKDIREMLEERAHLCFTDSTSYCGNQIVESGEQCDCGNVGDCETQDPCCMARDEENGVIGCILKATAQCSPKAGPCCTNDCKIINATQKKICQEETECAHTTFCDNGSCPVAQHKADNRICNNGSHVCKNGMCEGSICAFYGRTECPCAEPGDSCQVCCNNLEGECVSSAEYTGKVVLRPSKTVCDVNGYCDEGRCVEHVHELEERYESSFRMVLGWIKERWYVFMLIGTPTLIAHLFYSGFHFFRQRRARRRTAQPQDEGGVEMTDMRSGNQYEVRT